MDQLSHQTSSRPARSAKSECNVFAIDIAADLSVFRSVVENQKRVKLDNAKNKASGNEYIHCKNKAVNIQKFLENVFQADVRAMLRIKMSGRKTIYFEKHGSSSCTRTV